MRVYSGVGRILTKRGLKYSRARNFDHAHLITSRAAPRGMYVRTYVRMDMIWEAEPNASLMQGKYGLLTTPLLLVD